MNLQLLSWKVAAKFIPEGCSESKVSTIFYNPKRSQKIPKSSKIHLKILEALCLLLANVETMAGICPNICKQMRVALESTQLIHVLLVEFGWSRNFASSRHNMPMNTKLQRFCSGQEIWNWPLWVIECAT